MLERVAREHEEYQASVDEFQLWLRAVVERVHGCVGRGCALPAKLRLSALQVGSSPRPRAPRRSAPVWRVLSYGQQGSTWGHRSCPEQEQGIQRKMLGPRQLNESP